MAKNSENQGAFEIDEKSLDNILAQVEQELEPVLKAEKDRLVKAKEESSGGSSEKSSGGPPEKSASPEGSGDEGSGGPPPPGPGADGSAPPAGSPPMGSPSAPPAASPSPAAPAAGSPSPAGSPGLPTDPAALAQMVQQLPLEQQKALYLATKQALAASMPAPGAGAEGAGSPPGAGTPPMGSPPAAPPAPPMAPPAPPMDGSAPPMDPSAPPPMGKGEVSAKGTAGQKHSEGNGEPVLQSVHKSEKTVDENSKKIAAQDALIKSQGEKIDLMTKVLEMTVGRPMRKAVTSVAALKKTEDGGEGKSLTKSEMNSKLVEMIRGGKLQKKDQENVRKFFDQGSTDLGLIQHLFK